MQQIGLLWDSVSDNMGDVAIGKVLQRAFAKAKIPTRVIDPFHPDMTDVRSLVIGGGELIRAAGEPFYDVFRATGRHILNTVGVLDGTDTGYLDDYRLISVRTQADRARLGRGEVVPCLTLLYNDYLQHDESLPDIPPNAIGINLNYGFQDQIEPFVMWLKKAGLGPLVWLPITHYNADALLLQELAAYVPYSMVLPPLSPDATFRVIGKLSALMSSSLHGALFAYTQGIPTMGFRPVTKLTSFLEERGQGQSVFSTVDDIKRILPTLLNAPPDLSTWRKQDDANCRQWLGRVLAEAEAALSEPAATAKITIIPANERYHRLEMTLHRENGARTAQLARSQLQVRELRLTIETLRSTFVVRAAATTLWPVSARLRKLLRRGAGQKSQIATTSALKPPANSSYTSFVLLRQFRFRLTKGIRKLDRMLAQGVVKQSRPVQIVWAGLTTLRKHGLSAFFVRLNRWLRGERRYHQVSAFQAQMSHLEPSADDLRKFARTWQDWTVKPTISIVTVLDQPTAAMTQATVNSVLGQIYPNWVWHIGYTQANSDLAQAASKDARIKLVQGTDEALYAATNTVLRQVTGEYVLLLGYGDTLAAWALYAAAETVHKHPSVDVIYSDVDQIDSSGMRSKPCFKPDWSPEAMLGCNLLVPFGVVRREWWERLGYLRLDKVGVELRDFCLRLGEQTNNIQHIQQILYHAREQPHGDQTDAARLANQAVVLKDHLTRLGLIEPEVRFSATLAPEIEHPLVKWTPRTQRKVSIIIPTRNHAGVLKVCMDSLLTLTTGVDYEVILVDNDSNDPATLRLYQTYVEDTRIKIVPYHEMFNFGRACNIGAAKATGDVLLFLNNDTKILQADWLHLMVQWFDLADVGIVGPKLLYPDGKIQHAGVIIGLGFLAGHLFVGLEEYAETMFGTDGWYRNLLAVTGACVMILREAFEKVGGFDEGYQLIYSDIQLCLQIHRAGYRAVYTPHVRLIHYESQTHQRTFPRDDFDHALRDWTSQLQQGDPYFNPNFTYASAVPSIKRDTHETCYGHSLYLAKRMPATPIVSDDDLLYMK